MSARRRKTASSTLRALAGVQEDVLARVPSEIPRYTALGGVVLGTAVIASFSMWMAMSQVLGAPSLVAVVPAVAWGVFILNLDRWLVSSATGISWRTRASVLLPRLALALLLGVVIAEPIVLQVFRTAVEQRVRDDRKATIDAYESTLKRCNPVPPASNVLPGCDTYVLEVGANSAASNAAELARLRQQEAALQKTVTVNAGEVARLDELARRECNGTTGAGLTGRVGEGPNCKKLRSEAAEYRTVHRLAETVAELAAIRAKIGGTSGSVATAERLYETARNDVVKAKVAEKAGTFREIGLLERFEALERASSTSGFLHVARWFVTLVFIVLDCLPVLVKLMSRPTHYERMVHADASAAEGVFSAESGAALRARTSDIEADAFISELKTQMRRDEAAAEIRVRAADARAALDAEIDRLAALAAARLVHEVGDVAPPPAVVTLPRDEAGRRDDETEEPPRIPVQQSSARKTPGGKSPRGTSAKKTAAMNGIAPSPPATTVKLP